MLFLTFLCRTSKNNKVYPENKLNIPITYLEAKAEGQGSNNQYSYMMKR